MRRRGRIAASGEHGAATAEYVGVIVLVVAIMLTVVLAATPVGKNIVAKICQAIGTTCGETAPAVNSADEELLPPACMYREDNEEYSSEVSIGFVTLGNNSGFLVQRFRDGRVEVTVTDGAGIGAKGEAPGATFDVGKLGDGDNAGVDVELGGGLTFGYGDTWVFDSNTQYKQMREDLDDYLLQQQMLKTPDGSGGLGTQQAIKSMGGYKDPPKPPEVKFTKVGAEASFDTSFGLREPTGKLDENGEEEFIDPNAGFNLSVNPSGEITKKENTATGDVSWAYELTGEGSAGADVVAGGVSGEGTTQGAFEVTRNADGELESLEFKSLREGGVEGHLGNQKTFQAGGKAGKGEANRRVVTTRLEVDASNRDLAEGWLAEHNPAGEALDMSLPWKSTMPDQPSSDPFFQEMYENATTSVVDYHNVKDVQGFDVALKAGWKFGLNLSMEDSTAEAVDAEFLGAPGPDGKRVLIDDATCVK